MQLVEWSHVCGENEEPSDVILDFDKSDKLFRIEIVNASRILPAAILEKIKP